MLTGMSPTSISDFVAREQAVGQLDQTQFALDWFEAKEEELTQLLKDHETTI